MAADELSLRTQVEEIARTHVPREPVEERLPECDACSTYEPIAYEDCPAPILLARIRELEAVERAARDLLPFMPQGYAGVPLSNLRHALAALAGGERGA